MRILVIGGTRYFGKRLVHLLLKEGHEVTVLSRGRTEDDFGARVKRLRADRGDEKDFAAAIGETHWDVVVDQVCMTAAQARLAVSVLAGKVSYYLMTSTMSVYDLQADVKEEAVNPYFYKKITPTNPVEEYADGKRAAENIFAQQSGFKWAFARFPIVLGEDDYTGRLYGQIQKIREGQPIHYPNLSARMCFISSADAAAALLWLIHGRREGAYNFASPDVIAMKDLVGMIEEVTGKKALLTETYSAETHSPFGIPADWYLNVEKAAKEGYHAQPLSHWLRGLVESLAAKA